MLQQHEREAAFCGADGLLAHRSSRERMVVARLRVCNPSRWPSR
jgi:hypothetical protein